MGAAVILFSIFFCLFSLVFLDFHKLKSIKEKPRLLLKSHSEGPRTLVNKRSNKVAGMGGHLVT